MKILILLVLVIFLAACGKSDPPINAGTVIDKSYDDPDYVPGISTPGTDSESCYSDKYGEHCTNIHTPGVYIPPHWDSARWTIEVKGYDTKEHLTTQWIDVSEDYYNKTKIGDDWNRQ